MAPARTLRGPTKLQQWLRPGPGRWWSWYSLLSFYRQSLRSKVVIKGRPRRKSFDSKLCEREDGHAENDVRDCSGHQTIDDDSGPLVTTSTLHVRACGRTWPRGRRALHAHRDVRGIKPFAHLTDVITRLEDVDLEDASAVAPLMPAAWLLVTTLGRAVTMRVGFITVRCRSRVLVA